MSCDGCCRLSTTVIGAFPKPEYLKIPDFFNKGAKKPGLLGTNLDAYSNFIAGQTKEEAQQLERDIMKATNEVIRIQYDCGIDVPTDGEVRRENYIHYLCRFIDGIDFENLTETGVRNNAFKAKIPTIVKPVTWRGPMSCAEEFKKAQATAPPSVPVKYTLPGPMTIMGSTADAYYKDDAKLAADLAKIVNRHVLELAEAGCTHIQVDEPLFARKPDDALAWGIKELDNCFKGCPPGVHKQVHICCGYPGCVDQTEYLKADTNAYFRLAPPLDESCIDAVSIEDAWRNNDLSLLSLFKKTTVIFGTMNVSSSKIETVEEMRARLAEALKYIEPDRLIVAPDCGLGLLNGEYRPLLEKKLKNMCEAARRVPYTGSYMMRKRKCELA